MTRLLTRSHNHHHHRQYPNVILFIFLQPTILFFISRLGSLKVTTTEALTFGLGPTLPEIPQAQIDKVSSIVSDTLNVDGNGNVVLTEEERKIQVQALTANYKLDSTSTDAAATAAASPATATATLNAGEGSPTTPYDEHQFVYGELSIPTLATLFDAVGVRKGERFLDIGSGDGALVFAAPLLYDFSFDGSGSGSGRGEMTKNMNIHVSRGVEIVPDLFERSERYSKCIRTHMSSTSRTDTEEVKSDTEFQYQFHCGDIYRCDEDEILTSYLKDTTLAVCFATTWSRGNRVNNNNKGKINLGRRLLPELSNALGKYLPQEARVVIIDGRLDEQSDGFHWVGDLKIHCPDTAPYSIASLYERV